MGIPLNEIMDKLKAILIERHSETRGNLVMKFDDMIFLSDDLEVNEEVENILIDLAHNLEYYVSNPKWRREDPAYYGDEKLVSNINEAHQKIEIIRDQN